MNTLPTVSCYGQYSNDNYGINCLSVAIGSIRLFYSYQTIVAYRSPDDGLVVSENRWGTTTGKHLNWIDSNKSRRIPYGLFCDKLESMLARYVK